MFSTTLTVTTIESGTKRKEIGRSRNGNGSVVVVAMMLPFMRRRGGHDALFRSRLSFLLAKGKGDRYCCNTISRGDCSKMQCRHLFLVEAATLVVGRRRLFGWSFWIRCPYSFGHARWQKDKKNKEWCAVIVPLGSRSHHIDPFNATEKWKSYSLVVES